MGEGVGAKECFHSDESQNMRKGRAESREEAADGDWVDNWVERGREGRELLDAGSASLVDGPEFGEDAVGIGGDVVKEGNDGRGRDGGEVEEREGEEARIGEGEDIGQGREDGKGAEGWSEGKGEGDIGDIGKGKGASIGGSVWQEDSFWGDGEEGRGGGEEAGDVGEEGKAVGEGEEVDEGGAGEGSVEEGVEGNFQLSPVGERRKLTSILFFGLLFG